MRYNKNRLTIHDVIQSVAMIVLYFSALLMFITIIAIVPINSLVMFVLMMTIALMVIYGFKRIWTLIKGLFSKIS